MLNDEAQEALTKVEAFIAEHCEYTLQGVKQPGQGSTNQIVFARRGDDIVVFKVFCEEERKERECFGLRHWRETGFVPELICDADPRMIVMSYIPGIHLLSTRQVDGDTAWREVCYETGKAVGSLTCVPLSLEDRSAFESCFYGKQNTLEAYLGRILELGRSINELDPDFCGDFWQKNLNFIEAQLDSILSKPRLLYHQDVGNLHVQRGRFIGFFDLEMCRVGCATMQMASALDMFVGEAEGWWLFCKGWKAGSNAILSPDDFRSVAAAHYMLNWREISRYLSYDGKPGSGFPWATPADPMKYHKVIETVGKMLEIHEQ